MLFHQKAKPHRFYQLRWPLIGYTTRRNINWPVVYPKNSFKILEPVLAALPQNVQRILVATLLAMIGSCFTMLIYSREFCLLLSSHINYISLGKCLHRTQSSSIMDDLLGCLLTIFCMRSLKQKVYIEEIKN